MQVFYIMLLFWLLKSFLQNGADTSTKCCILCLRESYIHFLGYVACRNQCS